MLCCTQRCSKTAFKKSCMFFCQKFYAKCLYVFLQELMGTRNSALATITGRSREDISFIAKNCCDLVSSKQYKLQNCGDLKLKDKIKQS